MPANAKLETAAEAICSALYQLGWTLHGEPDGNRGTTWWIRGDDPAKLVLIGVERNWADANVTVNIAWRNFALPPRVLRCQQDLRITTDSATPQADIEKATQAAVHRCLAVFRDVVEGTGVASREAALVATQGQGGTT